MSNIDLSSISYRARQFDIDEELPSGAGNIATPTILIDLSSIKYRAFQEDTEPSTSGFIILSGASGSNDNTNSGIDAPDNSLYFSLGYEATGNSFGEGVEYGGGYPVLYSWMAPASGTATFETHPLNNDDGDLFDSILTVLDSGLIHILTFNDDIPGGVGDTRFYSQVIFSVVAGTTYTIAVDGYNGDSTDFGGYDVTNTSVGTYLLDWSIS